MTTQSINYHELSKMIRLWGRELGFSQIGICDVNLSAQESFFTKWLANNYHGNMEYMSRYGLKRTRPAELEPGCLRAICVRLDYLPEHACISKTLKTNDHGYISRYALGRDYHKLMRKRLKQLGKKISGHCAKLKYRPFVDTAPVLERPLGAKAGLGWVGKHSLLINQQAGSWFFLGELLVDIPLPLSMDETIDTDNVCGNCVACIKICPTQAIVEPYVVDARRCISYITIESQDPIPLPLRTLMGNRIYGCDDCQLICPWNKYSVLTQEADFLPRHQLDWISLLELFNWSEEVFLTKLEGSAIRRIGYQGWQRNISVALGNADYSVAIVSALEQKLSGASELVSEHINWALEQQQLKNNISSVAIDSKLLRLSKTIEKAISETC